VDRALLEKKYFKLGNELPTNYPKKRFDNHCYWRIALDNTLGDKWDRLIDRPAYKNLSHEQLQQVISLLESYKTKEDLLVEHNEKSLQWRGKS
jgi:hypothetical protein